MGSQTYLTSKPRYDILDGLRGVAALLVVCYHLLETYFHSSPAQPLNHGYLAVDFFFALSGFVIGYAYDDRWSKMSVWDFAKRRFIRLHPMLILGTLLGTLFFYFGTCSSSPLISETPWYTLLLAMLWCFTIIPMPPSMDIRGWAETNPLNGPVWSLQWEYLANFLYVLVFRRLPKWALTVCVLFFAVMTIMLCLDIDLLCVLSRRAYASYTVIGGWSLSPDQLQIGLTRLLYPFFSGLLLSRLGCSIKIRGGFWWCALALVTCLAMPWMGLGDEGSARWTNGLYEAVCILLFFPLIICMGAGSSLPGAKSQVLNKFLGDISYPLYITHYPFVYMQIAWAEYHQDAPIGMHIALGVSTVILAVLTAYASHRLYDLPVREWLKQKLFHTKEAG